jgi:dipeptidyl-peptidase-4
MVVLSDFVAFLGVLCVSVVQPPLQTTAEKSDFKATSRYAEVVAFCDALGARSPLVKVSSFGTSNEGRKLPLLVIADPPVASPAEVPKDKLVVLAFANIHAGEVDGKEALLALARDLTADKSHPLFKDLVLLVVPILNADGNEKISPKNRAGDNGPSEGAGTRANAQGLDLNRDFVKLETPEVRALVKLLTDWNPAMVIDCHTTNGTRHRFKLTYDGPRYPSDDPLAEWSNTVLFPDVTKRVKAAAGYDIAAYGNFSRDRTKWESYPATPRYGVQYFAVRGCVGVLSESYSYAPFKERVTASYAFVKANLEVAAAKRADLAKLVVPSPAKRVMTKAVIDAFPAKLTILGFAGPGKDETPKDYPLDYVARVLPKEVATVPGAYLVDPHHTSAFETLRAHGIKVDTLDKDAEMDVEAFEVLKVETAPNVFQKHNAVVVEVKAKAVRRTVKAGTVVVKTAQPLGRLAAYLLEPTSEDGLTTWNFFDKGLAVGKEFPVQRAR